MLTTDILKINLLTLKLVFIIVLPIFDGLKHFNPFLCLSSINPYVRYFKRVWLRYGKTVKYAAVWIAALQNFVLSAVSVTIVFIG